MPCRRLSGVDHNPHQLVVEGARQYIVLALTGPDTLRCVRPHVN